MDRVAGAVALSSLALLVQSPTAQPPVIRSRVDLVEVPAVVVDGNDRTIGGLTRDDFEVREDGRPVAIATFAGVVGAPAADSTQPAGPAAPGGRFIVLLLDDLFSSPIHTQKVREIARLIVNRMTPGDEIGVIRLNGDASRTTTDKAGALAAVDRYGPQGRLLDAQPAERQHLIDHAVETIGDLGRQMAPVQHRRKLLVAIGSSAMFEPTSGSPGLPLTYSTYWFDALRALAAANVSVYVVDPLGLPSVVPDVSSAGALSPGLAAAMANGAGSHGDSAISFAQETGGVAFVRTNRFDRAVEQIWREAGEYYLLGYEPPIIDGKPHRIAVRVKRRGAHVRARRTRF